MEFSLYQRIKDLCAERGITIAKLENDLGFGNSSIKKWERISSPSVDKIELIANYFNVSTDYLLGRTDIKSPVSEILEDDDVISFQRARQKMNGRDRERMMAMLKIGFDFAFSDQEDDDGQCKY